MAASRLKEMAIFAIRKKMRMYPNPTVNDVDRQAAASASAVAPASARGFTLLEVMIVIMIIGVMAAVAVPAYSTWRANQAVSSAQQTLLAQLKQARVLAVSENRSVSVTFTSTSYTFDANMSGTCDVCRNEQVNLGRFAGNLTLSPTTTRTFSSRGTANSGTITLTAGSSSRDITINVIGRAY
ncbi:type II secretion system protein GspH [Mariprofundus erugo]|uniref:GspH/FimT family pseudopilin n=1 Tax=Mariprofundus erugo TaxID=2528639 RepID=UPI0010FD16A4|nr:GspH/FimT family pseudopilin [Mariprofundus erugo]TLS73665.1 type II secretion system protein GspH [Mariprofundus erugo]